MKITIKIPTPPSVNRKKPFEIPGDLPPMKRAKARITVKPERRSGDVDNRIKPVLDALERRGITCAYVSCRFGKENKLVLEDYCERVPAKRRESAQTRRHVVSLPEGGRVGRGGREGGEGT